MKKIILAIGLGIAVLNAFAQTKESTAYSFSLKQAIDFAWQNSDSVKNALLDEEIARNKVKETTGLGLPQINGSFDVKDFLDIPTSLIPASAFGGGPEGSYIPAQFGTQYNTTAGLEASQLIFSGEYFLGLKAAKIFVEISTKATQRTKIETASTVSKAYYTVIIGEERVKLMDANIVRLKKTLDDTKALYENGIVEKIDYDRLSVTYNNLLVEQEKVNRLLTLGNYLLKYQMGMDINASLTLTEKLEDVKFDVSNEISAQKFDYSKRVEYGLFETQYEIAKLDLKRQKLAFVPNAAAYASVSRNAMGDEFDIFKSSTTWYPTSIIGAKVTIPIFSGGQRYYKVQQAKLSLMKAENNLDFMKKSIDLQLASSITSLQNAAASVESQKKNTAIAEEVARVAKLKYEQGVGSNLELITAETSLKEAQTNYYNALFDAIVAKIDFDKANGTLK